MGKLIIFSGLEIIIKLEKIGFMIISKKGSHVFIKHKKDDGTTIIPIHKGKDIDRSLLRKILRDVEISPEEFIKI